MNKWKKSTCKQILCLCLITLIFTFAGSVFAQSDELSQPVSPDILPPEVTLSPNRASPSPSPTNASGNPNVMPGNQQFFNRGNAYTPPNTPFSTNAPLTPNSAAPLNSNFTPNNSAVPAYRNDHPSFDPNQLNSEQPVAKPKCPTCGKKDPLAVIETTKGVILIRLYRKLAPRTVANFIDLSQKGFYNNLTFHRVVPGFVIQTGCPKGDGTGGYMEPGTNTERRVPLEVSAALKHNAAGVVAMAHAADPNSASSQFYITLSPQPSLDNQYAIFGGVVQGMDVANQINSSDRVLTVQVQERE